MDEKAKDDWQELELLSVIFIMHSSNLCQIFGPKTSLILCPSILKNSIFDADMRTPYAEKDPLKRNIHCNKKCLSPVHCQKNRQFY